VFTPASFELMVLELSALGFLGLRVEDCREATETEFYAWLRKGAERLAPDHLQNRRRALMNRIVVELADQSRQIADGPLAASASRARELDRAAELEAVVAAGGGLGGESCVAPLCPAIAGIPTSRGYGNPLPVGATHILQDSRTRSEESKSER
jgi:hypothetical protein